MTSVDVLSSATGGPADHVADAELIERVRRGDRDSYATLYERHGSAARRFARSLVTTDADADDVVAEVFARVLMAMERGKGPSGTFAPYLMSSIRHECYRVNRRGRRESTDRFDSVDGDGASAAHHDPYDRVDEASVVRVAFESLPAHQRELLWRTEVDELSPTELAGRSGSTPHAVAMMAMRARRALGSAYLDQHLTSEHVHHDLDSECRDARPHLVGFVRGTLGARRRRRIEAHLERCVRCDEARDGLGRLNTHLRVLPLLPLHAGAVGTASLGIKAQIVGWLSAQAVPVAASGMMAVSLLGPVAEQAVVPEVQVVEASHESPPLAVVELPTTRAAHPDRSSLRAAVADPPTTGTPATHEPGTIAPTMSAPPVAVAAGAPDDPTPAAPSRATPSHPAAPTPPASTDRVDAPAAPPAAAPIDDGHAIGPTGTPPGQLTQVANAIGPTGTPPGQLTQVANAIGPTGTPPGQLTQLANAIGPTGTPPGQLTQLANAIGPTGTPPGQLTQLANAIGPTGTPPGQLTHDDAALDAAGDAAAPTMATLTAD